MLALLMWEAVMQRCTCPCFCPASHKVKMLRNVLTLHMNLCLQARCKMTSILLRCLDMLLRLHGTLSEAMFSPDQSISGRGCFTRQLETLR